jgi:hypothetical protein
VNQPNYSDEVRAALRQRGALRDDDPPEPPEGFIRYHIAVEQTLLHGVAPATTVAVTLRGLADQIDPPDKENPHG